MEHEYSCGGVLFTRMDGEISFVLVISPDYVVGFPKGHMEGNETERQTALREICEETGVTAEIIDGFCERIEYELPNKADTIKHVAYFLAEYDGQCLKVPMQELAGIMRVPFEKAMEILTRPELKTILEKAYAHIKSL